MQPVGKYPYLKMTAKQIRRDAFIHLFLSPVMFIICFISVIGLFYFPVFLLETLKEIFIPNKLINKSKNELARDMEKDSFTRPLQRMSTQQKEKYKVV